MKPILCSLCIRCNQLEKNMKTNTNSNNINTLVFCSGYLKKIEIYFTSTN